MALQHETLRDFDTAYVHAFDAVQDFFRFAKRHPDAKADMENLFSDAYYERAADALKKRIDHELKYLHSPHLN